MTPKEIAEEIIEQQGNDYVVMEAGQILARDWQRQESEIAKLKRQLSEVRALCGRAARIPAIVREIEDHRQAHRWAEKNDAVAILDEELDLFDAASKRGEG